ncbi:MAG: DUF6338 family protein [Pseudonocardiaceae bacterium]
MVPASWLAVLLFILLVVPGLVFDILSERRRVGSSESTFREISRVVIASIGFSGATLLVLALVRIFLAPTWLPDPGALAREGSRYATQNYQVLAWTLGAGGFLSTIFAVGTHYVLKWKCDAPGIEKVSSWTKVFQHHNEGNWRVYVRVRLDDGAIYAGTLLHHTSDLENDDRELILGWPGLATKSPGGTLTEMPNDWKRIVIHSSAIKTLFVGYIKNSDDTEAAKAGEP